MTDVPKVELHVHLEGTAPPDLIRRLSERNGLPVPEGVFAAPDRFAYTDFLDFLKTYDKAASVIRTGEDYRDITYEYLMSCAAEGAVYVELTASPDHAKLVGLSDEEHLDGIARGIDDARADSGIEGRILISCVRNFGVEPALRVARYAAERPHPYVVGFSMAGDEENYPPAAYAEAFEIAERGIVLECCPTSNVVLGIYPSYEEHPLPRLREAGVRITLGSDDPPYFGASIGGEYEICREHFGFGDDDLRAMTQTAIEAAFCEPALKERLKEKM